MNVSGTAIEETEEDLLSRAQGGDRAALEALLRRHEAQIYRFGMRMCRDPEDARDVAQETLLSVAKGIGEFRGASSLGTWLYAIARSHCLKRRRRRKGEPADLASLDADAALRDGLADASRDPERVAGDRELERAVDDAVGRLDDAHREVLVLRDAEGLTAPEVAEVLGISVDAVKSRLHRARVAVRDVVAPLFGPPGAPADPDVACPDVVPLLSRHLEEEIDRDACAEMEAHVARCPRCRGACDSLRRTLDLCRRSGADAEVPQEVRDAVTVALRDFLADKNS